MAVKVIKPEIAADPEFRSRFRREVAAARTISGLYTALLIDADTDGPVPWLATAYVDGPSLNEAVSGYGPLPAGSVRTQAASVQPTPTLIIVTTTAPPASQPSSAAPKPTAPKTSAPVRTIAGTYAFAATVVSCTGFEVCATPMTLTFTCQSSTSCTMTGGAFKSAHAVSVSGNAIDSSGTDTGLTFCSNGAVTDDPYSLDLTVLSWSTGSVSVPTSMQGTHSDSEPGATGCNPGSSQQTFTYG